ncbi:hypothetical protein ABZY44_13745 [Streptomyces sp. NPDC006544]|uniref:hypothetical protein n=1 Tax=Streptomyces sp. NPDC006544 TaxID=3154583 RepID=UPI0033BB0CF7
MTGPEHYHKAEQLLADADSYEDDQATELARDRRAEAQVHALLALAAATAMAAPVDQETDSGMPPADATAWYKAAGTQPAKGGEAR